MINFIVLHWDSFLTAVLLVLFLLFLIRKGATSRVNKVLFYLVSEAEIQFGGGTGPLKFAAVTTWLYDRLPAIVKFIFTAAQIDAMIEQAVLDLKLYLEQSTQARNLITG